MNSMESKWLASLGLSGTSVNETTVPMFEQSGRRWYQLIALFRALGFPESGIGSLPTKIGYKFDDSGEFQKYQDTWYGTASGLSLYVEYLCMYQYSPTASEQNKELARTRAVCLQQWLSSIANVPLEPSDPKADENLPWPEDESANVPPDSAPNAEVVMCAARSSIVPDGAAIGGVAQPDVAKEAEAAIRATRSGLLPDGPAVGMALDALLDRTDLLCGAFGIDKGLPRDGKLARIIWLLMFEAYEFPYSSVGVLRSARPSVSDTVYEAMAEAMGPEETLWQGRRNCSVRDLVETAMLGR